VQPGWTVLDQEGHRLVDGRRVDQLIVVEHDDHVAG
jgi:hypothetical protein